MLSYYLQLETYFVNKSIASILNDVQIEYRCNETFVILIDASHRAKVTFDLGIICAFINNVNSLLNGEYFSSLQRASQVKGNDLRSAIVCNLFTFLSFSFIH